MISTDSQVIDTTSPPKRISGFTSATFAFLRWNRFCAWPSIYRKIMNARNTSFIVA